LANGRLLSFDPVTGRVTFRYKDYADADRLKELTLERVEFLHRWALHVLPPGFTKIRHFGLLAPNQRRKLLPQARTALETSPHRWQPTPPQPTPPPPQPVCPHCGSLRLRCIARVDRSGKTWRMFRDVIQPYLDSS
jgi:hypothetical protein